MDIIPVIDVRGGQAVRAVGGDRANYQPLVSPLAASSDPDAVAAGLMALYPFPVIYVADLDGIEGRGSDRALIFRLASVVKGELWVDCGASHLADVADLLALPRTNVVVGSETGVTVARLEALTAMFRPRLILSLDFRGDMFVGDPNVLATPASWPDRVIAMTLGRVGGAAGPDLQRLADVKTRAPGKVYAAGGVRNRTDLDGVARTGACGALVSTALHAQTITAADLV